MNVVKKEETDVLSQLKHISDHLGFLEKKLDTLIEQSKNQRPAYSGGFGNRNFQRPRPAAGQHSKYGGHFQSQSRPYDGNRHEGNRQSQPRRERPNTHHAGRPAETHFPR